MRVRLRDRVGARARARGRARARPRARARVGARFACLIEQHAQRRHLAISRQISRNLAIARAAGEIEISTGGDCGDLSGDGELGAIDEVECRVRLGEGE